VCDGISVALIDTSAVVSNFHKGHTKITAAEFDNGQKTPDILIPGGHIIRKMLSSGRNQELRPLPLFSTK